MFYTIIHKSYLFITFCIAIYLIRIINNTGHYLFYFSDITSLFSKLCIILHFEFRTILSTFHLFHYSRKMHERDFILL